MSEEKSINTDDFWKGYVLWITIMVVFYALLGLSYSYLLGP